MGLLGGAGGWYVRGGCDRGWRRSYTKPARPGLPGGLMRCGGLAENRAETRGVEDGLGPGFELGLGGRAEALANPHGQIAETARELAFEHTGFAFQTALLTALPLALGLEFFRPFFNTLRQHTVQFLQVIELGEKDGGFAVAPQGGT